jgi:rhodanese-related sulfurtransferase
VSVLSKLFGGGVPSVDAVTARQLVDDGAAMVDVRTTHEWNAGHAPFAVHLELGDLTSRLNRVPRNKKVVVVCRSGNRSRRACRQLAAAGYDVVNLRGGMSAWQRTGQPLVDRRGRPGGSV